MKHLKPSTPGQRGMIKPNRSNIYLGKPIKNISRNILVGSGRNHAGRITVRHRISPQRRSYRII